MERWHAGWALRSVEIIATEDQHRNAITPSVVNRHRRVLETNRAMDQRHDGLAGRLKIAVTHGDGGFLVRAGEEFRHRVLAVIDQGFVDPAVTRGRVGWQIFDLDRLDDVDHEIGARRTVVVGGHLWRPGFGGGDTGVRRQRRRASFLRVLRGGGLARLDGTGPRRAGYGSGGEEPAAIKF